MIKYKPFDGDYRVEDIEVISKFATDLLGDFYSDFTEILIRWCNYDNNLLEVFADSEEWENEDNWEYSSTKVILPENWKEKQVKSFICEDCNIYVAPILIPEIKEKDLEDLGFENRKTYYFLELTEEIRGSYIEIEIKVSDGEISQCYISFHEEYEHVHKKLKNVKTLEDLKILIHLLEVDND